MKGRSSDEIDDWPAVFFPLRITPIGVFLGFCFLVDRSDTTQLVLLSGTGSWGQPGLSPKRAKQSQPGA